MSPQTAAARAKEINVVTLAWIDVDPGNRGAGLLIENAAHWDEYGISTGMQLDAYLAHCEYVDLYKSIHNIKPRWTEWDDMTAEGWMAECQKLGEFYRELVRLEKLEEERIVTASQEVMKCEPLTFNPFAGLVLR